MNTDEIPVCDLSVEELSAALVGKTVVKVRPYEDEHWVGCRQLVLSDGSSIIFDWDPESYYPNDYEITIITTEETS